MADYTIPTQQEIALYDAMRLGGVYGDRNKFASDFLKANGIELPAASKPKIVISQKEERIYMDFADRASATVAQKKLDQAGIKATIYTGFGVPQDGSSITLDSVPFVQLKEFVQKTYPDITQNKDAYSQQVAQPLAKLGQDLAGFKAGFTSIALDSTLKRLGMIQPPMSNGDKALASELSGQISDLMSWGAARMPDDQSEKFLNLRKQFHENIATKLDPLIKMGTAPRTDNIGFHSISADGIAYRARSGTVDTSLPPAEAIKNYSTNQRADFEIYKKKFADKGLNLDHLREYKGTLGQFLTELADPKSPMGVALSAVSKDVPLHEAQTLADGVRRIYNFAQNPGATTHSYMDIPAKSAAEIFKASQGRLETPEVAQKVINQALQKKSAVEPTNKNIVAPV